MAKKEREKNNNVECHLNAIHYKYTATNRAQIQKMMHSHTHYIANVPYHLFFSSSQLVLCVRLLGFSFIRFGYSPNPKIDRSDQWNANHCNLLSCLNARCACARVLAYGS